MILEDLIRLIIKDSFLLIRAIQLVVAGILGGDPRPFLALLFPGFYQLTSQLPDDEISTDAGYCKKLFII